MSMDLNIIFEDNHIIVAEKPAGVLSQAGSLDLNDMLTEIKKYIKKKYQKPGNVYLGLVHRLDTNVGGVMVFAKTSKAASRLSEDIRNLDFDKNYLAVVNGVLPVNNSIELVDYLIKDEVNKIAIISEPDIGKKSVLKFKVLANENELSLIEIELETGRFHQIRAQLANYGYPIYNDGKYGKFNQGFDLGLYAYKISFNHPTLRTRVEYKIFPKKGVFNKFIEKIDFMEVSK
ncbi:MAG: RluA family pseudouridine synthase [Candidatus Izemoplasmatales bacterium]